MNMRSGFVSQMPVYFDSDHIIQAERGTGEYHRVAIETPWGLISQTVRRDRIVDKKGAPLFTHELVAA